MKTFFYKIYQKLVALWNRLRGVANSGAETTPEEMPTYKNCLNCGEELVGMYCHKCGQYASPPAINMSEFVKEYFRNIFSLESQSIPTLKSLIFRPGLAAKEFSAGRHASYLHPLKLNFFILVVLITIFSIVGTDDRIKDSFGNLTDKEMFVSNFVLSSINRDSAYMAKVNTSRRDTVKVVSSQEILENYPAIVSVVENLGVDDDPMVDTLKVSVPAIFIEDKFLVEENGVYRFDANKETEDWYIIEQMKALWEKAFSLIFAHFPLFMLFTVSFFVFPLRLVLRKYKYPMSNLYIFALYYVAFVETLLTILFLCGVIFGYSFDSVFWFLLAALLLYLVVALRNAYDIKSWLRAVVYAIIVNVVYLINTVLVLLLVSLVSIIIMVI